MPEQEALPMPSRLPPLAALATVLTLAAGCSSGPLPPGESGGDGSAADPTGSGRGSATGSTALAEATCWTGDRLGADPQDVLHLSRTFDVPYPVAARAVADRPAFSRRVSCSKDHAVEVFKVIRLPELDQQLTDYATLLRIQTPLYDTVARSVAHACMTGSLATAAQKTGLPGAVMTPALPAGAAVGWAPAAPEQWVKGQRQFACTLTWSHPEPTPYATVFTKGFPTGRRTCIDSKELVFVDCARPHDRERIAVIEARDAVAAGAFPGPAAIKDTPQGKQLDVGDAAYRKLDAACTAYLRTISTTKKLTGVANVDLDRWPTPDGLYPIYCDADTRPDQDSLITEGSVYNR